MRSAKALSSVYLGLLAAACAAPGAPLATPLPGARFPADWVGVWEGQAQGLSSSGRSQSYAMAYAIAPTADPSRYTWTIRYDGEAGLQVRPYELIVRDAEAGEYAIDEHNGVVLEARLIGGALYTAFDIQGVRLITRDMLVGGGRADAAILFELISGSGRSTLNSGTDTPVTSYPPGAVQRATLRRRAGPGAAD